MCLIIRDQENKQKKDHSASLTYLITQTIASIVLILSWYSKNTGTELTSTAIFIRIVIKIGCWPIHSWYSIIIEKVELRSQTVKYLITWQKAIPLIVITSIETRIEKVISFSIISIIATTAILTNKISLKRIITYSSMFYRTWIIIITLSTTILNWFILIYWISTFIALEIFKNVRTNVYQGKKTLTEYLVNMSNLGGIPPTAIFSAKISCIRIILWKKLPVTGTAIIITSCVFMFNYMWASLNQINTMAYKTQIPITTKKTKRLYIIVAIRAVCMVIL